MRAWIFYINFVADAVHKLVPPPGRGSLWLLVQTDGMSFAQDGQIDRIVAKLKQFLGDSSDNLKKAFDFIDKDRSNALSQDEFVVVLKEAGITLPPHMLTAVVSRFDPTGDGSISIPEFMAFMTGNTDQMEALRSSASPSKKGHLSLSPSPSNNSFPSQSQQMNMFASPPRSRAASRPATSGNGSTVEVFLSRMDGDIESRRRTSFVRELKKDPRFEPRMLEPSKPKFQLVELGNGPIIKTVNARRTGLETGRSFKWGPLGGYY